MRHILTSFDYDKYPPVPLQSIVVDNDKRFITLYHSGSGLKLSRISENMRQLKELLCDGPCILNDVKSHLQALKLSTSMERELFDLCLPRIGLKRDHKHTCAALVKLMKSVKGRIKPFSWRKLMGRASEVYLYLEEKPLYHGFKRVYPRYSLETFTGRSKTKGFNIQGTTEKFDIQVDVNKGYFVHFDWVAADLLIAAVMSNDTAMLESFRHGDPYSDLQKRHNHPQYDRDRCKTELLSSIYALRFDNPVLDYFPELKRWMRNKYGSLRDNGYLESILGRRFRLGDRNELSVFNAQFQGSVAHAMQAALIKIFGEYPDCLVAEVHDSVVMFCDGSTLRDVISDVVSIMMDPLSGWLGDAPKMPVKVSVGRKWKKWVRFREYRPS